MQSIERRKGLPTITWVGTSGVRRIKWKGSLSFSAYWKGFFTIAKAREREREREGGRESACKFTQNSKEKIGGTHVEAFCSAEWKNILRKKKKKLEECSYDINELYVQKAPPWIFFFHLVFRFLLRRSCLPSSLSLSLSFLLSRRISCSHIKSSIEVTSVH